MTNKQFILAIDQGTSSTKSLIFDAKGQAVAKGSENLHTHYFGDGFVKDYEKVPDAIRKITRERMLATAREFIAHNTWVLAGVSSGTKDELVELNDKLQALFRASDA